MLYFLYSSERQLYQCLEVLASETTADKTRATLFIHIWLTTHTLESLILLYFHIFLQYLKRGMIKSVVISACHELKVLLVSLPKI